MRAMVTLAVVSAAVLWRLCWPLWPDVHRPRYLRRQGYRSRIWSA